MDNTVPAQEIKRRGIAAVDELLKHGPVHVIRHNRPQYVILTEEAYRQLAAGRDQSVADLWQWLEDAAAEPGKSGHRLWQELDQDRSTEETMGNRLSKIATRTGDEGRTGLGDGSRVDKDSHRVEAFGEVDELNSFMGRLLAHELPEDVAPVLAQVQNELFDLGAELAVPGHSALPVEAVDRLDGALAYFNDSLPHLKEFILPGGGKATADCHVARAVCRRAERKLVALSHHEAVRDESMAYLNRLSDLLFVVARVLSRYENGGELLWRPAGQRAADGD